MNYTFSFLRRTIVFSTLVGFLALPSVAFSQSGTDGRYLPGEEVTTQSGKKVRVWSTKGPVPVSKAPEPFEDADNKSLQGVPVIVDYDAQRRGRPNRAVGVPNSNMDLSNGNSTVNRR